MFAPILSQSVTQPNEEKIPGGIAALVGVFTVTLLVRLLRTPNEVTYDEGVYVTGAMMLSKGLLPYRDYVLLHPPGMLLFLFPWTLGGPAFALTAARTVACFVGATNATLMARLVGGRAALPVALLWVVWPDLVASEHGAFLEPLMTCTGLGALVLLKSAPGVQRVTWAGMMCGACLLVKSWGGLWCLMAFLACPGPMRRRLVLSAVATVVVVLFPFLVAGGQEMISELFIVHVGRPPDGDLSRGVRLEQMFLARNPIPGVLTVLAIPIVLIRGGPGRIALVGFGLLSVMFLAIAAYWNQYNSALIPFELWLLGSGLNFALAALGRRWWVGGLVACAAAIPSVRLLVPKPPLNLQPETTARLRVVDKELCAFESFELLLANRLPPTTPPVLVDSYGQMLRDGLRDGARYESSYALFSSEAAQLTIRKQLAACPALRMGWRGDWQLNAESKALLEAQFTPLGEGLWERK